jgi:hypothetical protein
MAENISVHEVYRYLMNKYQNLIENHTISIIFNPEVLRLTNSKLTLAIGYAMNTIPYIVFVDNVTKETEIICSDISQEKIIKDKLRLRKCFLDIFKFPFLLRGLLFIETKLLNLHTPMDDIYINTVDISQSYLDDYYHAVLMAENQKDVPFRERKNGIIMCHGHKHKHPKIFVSEPADIDWVLVDINNSYDPDIIGSFKDEKVLSQLGYGKWDYVVDHYCPTRSSKDVLSEFVFAVSSLLKSGGKVIIVEGRNLTTNVFNHYLQNNGYESSKVVDRNHIITKN